MNSSGAIPDFGCPKIAQHLAKTFGLDLDKDVVRRVLATHYRPDRRDHGPSWLTLLGHTKDSLWSLDLFRTESILLRSHWVLVVLDQFTRRIVGFGVQAVAVDGPTLRAGEPTVNPTGTWKVTITSTNAQVRLGAQTLKLRLNGGTLTGTLSYNSSPIVNGKARVSELPITEAKLQGNEISFNFTHPPSFGSGPSANYSYRGKISGDSIKGSFTTELMGESRTRGWEAKRLKD